MVVGKQRASDIELPGIGLQVGGGQGVGGGGVAAVWASKQQARKYRNTPCVFIKAQEGKRKHTR